MSAEWAKRQRQTNKLVRFIASYLFSQTEITPDQLYGLCQLTWITRNSTDSYIKKTKIPALENIFNQSFSHLKLQEAVKKIYAIRNISNVEETILVHSGFTNIRNSIRNSSRNWIKTNYKNLLPMFKSAFTLENDSQGLDLIKRIAELPGIPTSNNKNYIGPERLLTPVFFALDKRIRFPIINGNEGVTALLKKLDVHQAPLDEQYQKLIDLYGTGGIVDAADLDQARNDLHDFIDTPESTATKQFFQKKPTEGNELLLKDESDIESLQEARKVVYKRLHNKLTNDLTNSLSEYTLLEGSNKLALFDVLVKKYDGENDLLIEVKSATEPAHIRMAIGQLYAYWHQVMGEKEPHLAILLPSMPDTDIINLLEWREIGILWYAGEKLATCSEWLEDLVE